MNKTASAFACSALPVKMCHASNLLVQDDRTILCAFFGGSFEGDADTAIYLSYLKDGTPVKLIKAASGREAHWNPVLFHFPDGRIGLIFKRGNVIASWRSYIMESCDGGESFSPPRELVPGDTGGRGPVRNKIVTLKSGRMLCPGSLEDGPWRAFVDISDDGMQSLRKSPEIRARHPDVKVMPDGKSTIAVSAQSFAGQGVIQPSLWEDESGVHMLLRSTYGCIMRSDSADEGESWSEPRPIPMPNNNSGLDLTRLNGRIYLACNPVGGNWAARSPLTLFSSADGINFTEELVLENEPGGEFSYPCIRAYQGSLYVSYTYNRRNIKIVKLDF